MFLFAVEKQARQFQTETIELEQFLIRERREQQELENRCIYEVIASLSITLIIFCYDRISQQNELIDKEEQRKSLYKEKLAESRNTVFGSR